MSRLYEKRAAVAGLTARKAEPERIEAARQDLRDAKAEETARRLVANVSPIGLERVLAIVRAAAVEPSTDDGAADAA